MYLCYHMVIADEEQSEDCTQYSGLCDVLICGGCGDIREEHTGN